MPDVYSWDVQSQDDQFRFDQSTPLTDWIDGDAGGGSTSRQVSATTTWTVNFNVGIQYDPLSVFKAINASIGGSYSTAQTIGDTYTFNLSPGQRARIVHTPRFHHIVGFLTETSGGDPMQVNGVIQTPVVTVIDHQPGEAWFPEDGGLFRLQYSIPAFYTDFDYQGIPILLNRGNWDVGSFPNDAICSMSIPDGYTVELFSEANFQGRSITLSGSAGQGENPHFGDDWIRQASSIKIW